MMNNNVFVSEKFDMDDIRRIRDNNSIRHSGMSTSEIIKDINDGANEMLKKLAARKAQTNPAK